MTVFEIKSDPEPTDADVQRIRRGLREFNNSISTDLEPVVVIARDEADEVIAGLVGWTWARWLEIETLWVSEKNRHRGYGTRLLQMAESEAARRGCEKAYLNTFSFQARPLYERLGYRAVGSIQGFPPGHERYIMIKSLA
jgi:GNAT superfamily N-acetyltransferase